MNEQNTNRQPNYIPDFSGIEEEAAFWDTHDTTEFEEAFHQVIVHFDKQLSDTGKRDSRDEGQSTCLDGN